MRRIVAVLAALSLAVSACGGDDVAAPEPTTTTTAALGPTAPLTGLPLDDAPTRDRTLLTVKIDNHPDARPQYGIDRADVIVEEKVEGGLSRFMALFHSQDANQVGPVRSLRNTDVGWARPLGGMMAYSGGIDQVKAQLRPAGIADIGADSNGPKYYKRRSDRPFEHSMTVDTSVLRELTPDSVKAPPALFEYLDLGSNFGGTTAVPSAGASLRMAGVPTAVSFDWTWDGAAGVFRRGTDGRAHEIEGVGQIGMKNVIVQFTPYRPTPFRDAARSPVDEAVVTGEGEAWVFSDGKLVRGRWSRPSADVVTGFTDSTGAVIEMQRGQTWLSLVPPGEFTEVK